MTAPADLEIGLHRWNADSYVVELRYTHPESDTDAWNRSGRARPSRAPPPGAPEAGAPGAERTMASFDLGRLRTIQEGAYGEALSGGLFGDPPVRAMFAQARSIAQSVAPPAGAPPSAPGPRSCTSCAGRRCATRRACARWRPTSGSTSRYLSSLDWHPVRPRPGATSAPWW